MERAAWIGILLVVGGLALGVLGGSWDECRTSRTPSGGTSTICESVIPAPVLLVGSFGGVGGGMFLVGRATAPRSA